MYRFAWFLCAVLASSAIAAQGDVPPPKEDSKKLTDQQLELIRDGFDKRVNDAFEAQRGKPLVREAKRPPLGPGRGNYVRAYSWSLVDFATRCLRLNEQIDAANAAIIENAQHYLDHPADINDRDSFHWHADMLCRLIECYGAKGSIAPSRLNIEAEAKSMEILWRYASQCVHPDEGKIKPGGAWLVFGSDNHHVMDFTAKWHFAKLAKDWPDFRDRKYSDGTTAATQYAKWNDYLKIYCTERAKKGLFVEFASNYNTDGTRGFYNIYDFTDDPVLRQRMEYLLDLHWAMWAQEQIDGVRGGGKARMYQSGGDRSGNSEMRELAWYYFGIGEPSDPESPKLPALTSGYRPPLVVVDLAVDVAGRGQYEVLHRPLGLAVAPKERRGSHQLPFNDLKPEGGSLVCYSWCTPSFILGTPMVEPRPADHWVGMSAQNRWHGAIFAGDINARIVPQVRAKDNRALWNAQWSVQHKGTLICQKLKTNKGGQEMRVWFSRPGLTDRREEGGWVFVEAPAAYAAVRVVHGGAEWENARRGLEGSWLRCRDEWTPVVLEVSPKEDFEDYAAFRKAVAALPLSFENGVLRYQGLSHAKLTFYTTQRKNPEINGKAIDYTPPMVLDSPFLKARWNNGVVTIAKDGRSRVLDFNRDPDPKLNVPRISSGESLSAFEARRERLLEDRAGRDVIAATIADPTQDVYATRAIANLHLGRFPEAANARIRRTAEWFEHEHPHGQPIQGECDFAAKKLCCAYYLLKDTKKLEPATVERIRQFFFTKDFCSMYDSENHHLLFHTSRYLMGLAFPDAEFAAYGKKGRDLAIEDVEWLRNYLRYRARRGWGEFDSQGYISVAFECAASLYDHAPDAELRRLAQMTLDLLLVDMASDSLHGIYGGAHGRGQAGNHAATPAYALQDLYFGNVDRFEGHDAAQIVPAVTLEAALSSYRPSEILVDLALDRPHAYANRERKHLHNPGDVMPQKPLEGSIRKYTWYTPEFLMGCVQWQDPYPNWRSGFDRYARHSQHEWDLSIGTRTCSRLFTHHPGDTRTHTYWTGDTRCRCGHFFEHEGALVALYDIPADERYQLIHAYVPKAAFDELVEENGTIFVQEGNVCAALHLLSGYEWTTEGRWRDEEIISRGNRHGVVCEAASLSDAGSFEAFRRQILANPVVFDRERMLLTYRSQRYGTLRIDTKGLRELNGQMAALDYPTYHNPYVHSDWDSGIVEIAKGARRLRLDFPAAKRLVSDAKQTVVKKTP